LVVTTWLIDKSAYTRLGTGPDAELWAERVGRGLVRIGTVTRLELGYSARSGDALRTETTRAPLSLLPIEFLTPAMESRALAVQQALADRGEHRAPSVADLLVAATAELSSCTVLHLDKDFDLIAEITGQPTERLRSA
jgi:predicted nucleic acid-binding protein